MFANSLTEKRLTTRGEPGKKGRLVPSPLLVLSVAKDQGRISEEGMRVR